MKRIFKSTNGLGGKAWGGVLKKFFGFFKWLGYWVGVVGIFEIM